MSEHTPTTENIRQTFAYVQAGLDHDDGYPMVMDVHLDSFDRWLAAEVRRAKAEAWREGHKAGWIAHYNGDDLSVYRNPYRADQIEKEATHEHP